MLARPRDRALVGVHAVPLGLAGRPPASARTTRPGGAAEVQPAADVVERPARPAAARRRACRRSTASHRRRAGRAPSRARPRAAARRSGRSSPARPAPRSQAPKISASVRRCPSSARCQSRRRSVVERAPRPPRRPRARVARTAGRWPRGCWRARTGTLRALSAQDCGPGPVRAARAGARRRGSASRSRPQRLAQPVLDLVGRRVSQVWPRDERRARRARAAPTGPRSPSSRSSASASCTGSALASSIGPSGAVDALDARARRAPRRAARRRASPAGSASSWSATARARPSPRE